MNNKGFTIVEIIVSFILISAILTALITVSIKYREKVEKERLKTEIVDYKNTITKIIYDDIVSEKFIKMEYCLNNKTCVSFLDKDGISHELNYQHNEKVLFWNNEKYQLPNDSFISDDFNLRSNLGIYNLIIKIKNEKIKYADEIILSIN